jgi:carboxymethylenebutenolidase
MPGAETKSYVAAPRSDSEAVVVVLHDWYGRLPHVNRLCDRLAQAGFLAVAPDMYDGRTATEDAEAEKLMEGLAESTAKAKFEEAVESARTRGAQRLGLLGFSMGGGQALGFAAESTPAAAAIYYASYAGLEDKITCPVLGNLAEHDPWEEPEPTIRFFESLPQGSFHLYPGTEHSFANEDVFRYNPKAAEEAWERSLRFLRRHLLAKEEVRQ